MSTIPLRQRSSTEIVDAAFQLFRREPLQFILAVALINVPWLIIQLATGLTSRVDVQASAGQLALVLIGAVVVYSLIGGVTTVLATDVYFGRPTDLGRAFRTVGSRAATLIVVAALSSLASFVGLVILLLPSLYAIARLFCVQQAVLIEDASVARAFSRSSTLSTDAKGHILKTVLLTFLMIGALNIGRWMLVSQIVKSTMIQAVIATMFTTVLFPFFSITKTLLYFDMRIRKEGFDIEYLASTVSAGDAAAPVPTA